VLVTQQGRPAALAEADAARLGGSGGKVLHQEVRSKQDVRNSGLNAAGQTMGQANESAHWRACVNASVE